MPFIPRYDESKSFINLLDYNPISVIANFAYDGRMMPIYVRYVNPDESIETLKISFVKDVKDIMGGTSFVCEVEIHGYIKEITLVYIFNRTTWYTRK